MKDKKTMKTTTFQLTPKLLTEIRVACLLTEKSQGEFIRISIRNELKKLNEKNN
jgi:hypothetical protein